MTEAGDDDPCTDPVDEEGDGLADYAGEAIPVDVDAGVPSTDGGTGSPDGGAGGPGLDAHGSGFAQCGAGSGAFGAASFFLLVALVALRRRR